MELWEVGDIWKKILLTDLQKEKCLDDDDTVHEYACGWMF